MSDETPHMTQTNFAFHSEDLYAPLIWRVLSQNNDFFAYFHGEMVKRKHCSREECKRDSRMLEKVVWVAKWMWEIQKENEVHSVLWSDSDSGLSEI